MQVSFDPVAVRSELEALALSVFVSDVEASQWMAKPHPVLGGRTPDQASQTQEGAQQVNDILVALKFGGVA